MNVGIATGVRRRTLAETRLLWLTLGSTLVWGSGGHVDARYHFHYGFEIESFFTWPHAMLYGGWAATGSVVAAYLLEGLRRGTLRRAWLPPGYRLVLLGFALFGLGGALDWGWHMLFGFEANLETLVAPSHLWLVVSFLIAVLGLLQAALVQRAKEETSGNRLRLIDLPVLLSLGVLFRSLLWNFFYSDPLAIDYASHGALADRLPGYGGIAWENLAAQAAGTSGIVLHSIILALFLVSSLHQLRLPGGAIAIMMLWDNLLVAVATDMWLYLPAAAGAAFVGEVIWALIRHGRLGGADRAAGYRVLAFTVPTVQWFLYFALMEALGGGIAWTTHLWAGAAVMGGFYGLAISLFVVPPRFLRAPIT
jgi:hypothetical protein